VLGRLYDLGDCPGLILDPSAAAWQAKLYRCAACAPMMPSKTTAASFFACKSKCTCETLDSSAASYTNRVLLKYLRGR
jgi:hypothetical protein